MVDRTFNVSAQDDEKQKRERQKLEAEQTRKAEQIRDSELKREVNAMMNKRDNAHEISKSRDEEKIQRTIDAEMQKRVQPKPQMHLRPKGMGGDTRENQAKRIREDVRKNVNEGASKRREAERTIHNRQIDKKIDHALSEQSRTKEPSKARSGWDRHASGDRSNTRSGSGWDRHRGDGITRERKPS